MAILCCSWGSVTDASSLVSRLDSVQPRSPRLRRTPVEFRLAHSNWHCFSTGESHLGRTRFAARRLAPMQTQRTATNHSTPSDGSRCSGRQPARHAALGPTERTNLLISCGSGTPRTFFGTTAAGNRLRRFEVNTGARESLRVRARLELSAGTPAPPRRLAGVGHRSPSAGFAREFCSGSHHTAVAGPSGRQTMPESCCSIGQHAAPYIEIRQRCKALSVCLRLFIWVERFRWLWKGSRRFSRFSCQKFVLPRSELPPRQRGGGGYVNRIR